MPRSGAGRRLKLTVGVEPRPGRTRVAVRRTLRYPPGEALARQGTDLLRRLRERPRRTARGYGRRARSPVAVERPLYVCLCRRFSVAFASNRLHGRHPPSQSSVRPWRVCVCRAGIAVRRFGGPRSAAAHLQSWEVADDFDSSSGARWTAAIRLEWVETKSPPDSKWDKL